jgi:hypothetical protein
MPLEPDLVLILVLVATVAGLVDAIAGGGGLLTLPALLLAGLPPVDAIATNKLQGTFGVGAASFTFWRAGHIDALTLAPAVVAAAAGALAGSIAVLNFNADWLQPLIPVLLIAVAIYFGLAPQLSSTAPPKVPVHVLAPALGFAVGAYDGFLGPGTGSFLMAGLVALGGLGLIQATASTKLLNLASNAASLGVFLLMGHVHLSTGLAMAAGQLLGGALGARLALEGGARLIRPLVIAVSIAIAVKVLLDQGAQMPIG